MLPRERVIAVINHQKPDRVPIYGWVKANLKDQISAVFGSVEKFEDKYEFDFAHIFGGPRVYDADNFTKFCDAHGGAVDPATLLEVPLLDPNDHAAYQPIIDEIRHHKTERGRFVYVQTPGIFEALNGAFGIENHLAYLLLHEDDLRRVYRRQAEWNRTFAMNCLDLGVDMVHVSDDWGAQHSLLFGPDVWWRLIRPHHQITCEAVRRRGAFLSLHCDGNFAEVIDGVIGLGYQVVHPWQESAGMSLAEFKNRHRQSLTLMGGLDVQTTIGFGRRDFLRSEIERVMRTFADGGLLFCTSHFVQDHCTVEELTFAYDTAYELARTVCRSN